MKKKMIQKIAVLMAAILAMATVLVGCGSDDAAVPAAESSVVASTGTEGEGEKVFKMAFSGDIVSFDPAYGYDGITCKIQPQVLETLLTFDKDNQLVNQLITGWEQPDEVTYVYHVRDDIKFSDGNPMTMEDVLFSIEHHMDPEVASYVGWMLDGVESIEQTGDWEFTIKLKEANACFKYVLATSAGMIFEKAFYEENPEEFGKPGRGVVATGAFKFDSWTSGTEIVLSKNENYRDAADVEWDQCIFEIITEDLTQVNALTTGQVNMIFDPSLDVMSKVEEAQGLDMQLVDTMGSVFLAYNCQGKFFSDVNLRKACAYAIDSASLVENVLYGYGKATKVTPVNSSLWVSDVEGWQSQYDNDLIDYSYNLDTAKEYMAKSQYASGFDCTLVTRNDSSTFKTVALIIQASLQQLGINVTIEEISYDEWVSAACNHVMSDGSTYDMILYEWYPDYPDPSGYLEPVFGSVGCATGGSNYSLYSNSEFDALIAKELNSIDDAERQKLMQEATAMLNDDIPSDFLYLILSKFIYDDNLEVPEISSGISLWGFYVKNIHTK